MDLARRHRSEHVSPQRGQRSRATRVARLVATALLGIAAGAFVTISLVPYETLKDHLDPLSVDSDADFSRAKFDDLMLRLRLLAVGFGALAGVLLALGRPIDRVTEAVAHDWWRATKSSPRHLRYWAASEDRAYLVAFGLVLVTAVALRVGFLDVTLRYDEATTYNNFVSKPLYVGLAHYPLPNNHLFHTFLAKISVTVFGTEPWAIRLPALAAGLALVPATFALSRVFYGRAAALLAAALVASSSTLVEYSTNARGYTIVALLTVIALIAAARVLETDSVGAWAVIAGAGAVGLWAVPVMLYPLGGILLWLILSRSVDRRPFRPLLWRLATCACVTATLTLLLYAPVFAASGVRSVTSNDFVEPRSFGAFLELVPGHVRDTLDAWVRDVPLFLAIALAAGLVASLLLTPRLSRYPVPPLVAILAWAVPVVILQRVVPFTRVWLFLVPIALTATAALYGWLLERAPRSALLTPVAAVALAIGGAWAVQASDSVRESRETGALLDAPAVAAFLAERVQPGDRIFATGSDTILEYYLERRGVDAGPLLFPTETKTRTFLVVNVLGGQILEHYYPELDPSLGPPRLVRRFPSALVYVVEPRA